MVHLPHAGREGKALFFSLAKILVRPLLKTRAAIKAGLINLQRKIRLHEPGCADKGSYRQKH